MTKPMPMPVYLDHHATTPCDARVVEAMLPYFTEKFGNAASRTHIYGFVANTAVERAREQVASLIGASPKEIVFTSGATEANNLAVLGAARALRGVGRHVIVSAIEHKAVLDPAKHLEAEGFEVTVLPVGSDGRVSPADVAAAMRPGTALVSVMLANNEIGTLQPLAEIAEIAHAHGAVVHTDAAQAPGKLAIDVGALGVDLLSLSAHKMYGPKGIGALYVRRDRRPRLLLEPLVYGGGHERGLRSGTLPVPMIVALGAAAQLAADDVANGEPARLATLRDRLLAGLRAGATGVVVHGSLTHRLPNNLSVSFDGVDGEALILSTKEIAVSSGSACTSATLEPSHVLRAIGVDKAQAHGSIRIGLGRSNGEADVELAISRICGTVERLRELDPMVSRRTDPAEVRWTGPGS